MQYDESTNIPFPVRDSLNLLLGTIARDNLLSLENLVQHDDSAVSAAISILRQTSFLEPFLTAFANGREGIAKLKPKHRTGGALAGRIRKDLGITQNPPGRAKVADKASCEALAALKQKHRILALHHVIRGELSALDPAIGDAACEMRPSFLLDIHQRLKGLLPRLGISRSVIDQAIRAYDARHRQDAPDERVQCSDDIAVDPDGADDVQLWTRLFEELTVSGDPVEAGPYLQLCKSYTEASSLTLDEFGLPVASRLRRRHPLTQEVADLEALGQATRATMLWMAEQVAKHEAVSSALDPGLAGQLLAVLRSCGSLKEMEGARLPLVPIYEALYTILAYEAMQGRPLFFSTVHLEGSDKGLRLIGTDLVALRPCSENGQFEPTEEAISEPAMTFRSLSIRSERSGASLPALTTLSQYARDFILAYAAAHPPFAEGAEVKEPVGEAVASYLVDPDVPTGEGVDRSLYCWFRRHRRLADRLGLSGFRYSERVDRDLVRRTAQTVGLVPIHIHAATMAEERARLGRITWELDGVEVDPCFDLKKKGSRKRSQQSVPV